MRRVSRLCAAAVVSIGVALATGATASATPHLYLVEEGTPMSVGASVYGEFGIVLFNSHEALAECIPQQPGVILSNGRIADAVLFEHVVEHVVLPGEDCFEVPPFDFSHLQEGSAARLTLTVAASATLVFKPALVMVEGLSSGGICHFAIKKLEGTTSLTGASFDVSGAALRLPKLSAINCPSALLVDAGGVVTTTAPHGFERFAPPVEMEVRAG